MASSSTKGGQFMKDLIIEDFPMSEIEFEKRISTELACMDYLAKMKSFYPG
jgi:hypothetical protein